MSDVYPWLCKSLRCHAVWYIVVNDQVTPSFEECPDFIHVAACREAVDDGV